MPEIVVDTSTSALPGLVAGVAEAVGARDWPRLVGWAVIAVLAAANLVNPLRWVRPTPARMAIVYAVAALGGLAASLIAGAAWSGALGSAVTAALVVLRTPGAYDALERAYDEARP